MRPTFANRIDAVVYDDKNILANYADIYGLIDKPPADFKPSDYGMTEDEAVDYLDGFDRNYDKGLEIAGEYMDEDARSAAIEEVLMSDE